jgi:hypothetical protein
MFKVETSSRICIRGWKMIWIFYLISWYIFLRLFIFILIIQKLMGDFHREGLMDDVFLEKSRKIELQKFYDFSPDYDKNLIFRVR